MKKISCSLIMVVAALIMLAFSMQSCASSSNKYSCPNKINAGV